jgi:tetratricopeptide (TPR) repeat protein
MSAGRFIPALRPGQTTMSFVAWSSTTLQGAVGRSALALLLVGSGLPFTVRLRAEPGLSTLNLAERRAVNARELPGTSVDSQVSWLLEPDVPRIPKIAGLNAQLPPHIERRLSYAFDLAQRGALYSANAEFRAVIGLAALELDARAGSTEHRDAYRLAFVALEEADDFAGDQLDWHDSSDVRQIIAEHTTAVLKSLNQPIESVEAVQKYYAFAEERFTAANKELPGTSLAFYGLARTYVEPGMHTTHAAAKAVLLQRVAIAIAPQNTLAGNELGVLLAQHGQLTESLAMFRQSLAMNPRPETWRNLSAVYARQGDLVNSKSALAACEAMTAQEAAANANSQPATAIANDNTAAKSESTDGERKPTFISRLSLPSFSVPFRR